MTQDIPWNTYRQHRIEALQHQGYLVRAPANDNWIHVGAIESPGATQAESYLAAQAQHFQVPSRFGIDEGRVSRLYIARYQRPTCRQLFLRSKPDRVELYNFDRGLDYNRLKDDEGARKFYQDLVDLLN